MRLKLFCGDCEKMPSCDPDLFVAASAVDVLKVLQGNREMLGLRNAFAKDFSLLCQLIRQKIVII